MLQAGQEAFKSITRQYYRGTAAALLVYDVTNKKSFDDASSWLTEIRKHGSRDTTVILVGNKCDLRNNRQISSRAGNFIVFKP